YDAEKLGTRGPTYGQRSSFCRQTPERWGHHQPWKRTHSGSVSYARSLAGFRLSAPSRRDGTLYRGHSADPRVFWAILHRPGGTCPFHPAAERNSWYQALPARTRYSC